LASPGRQRSPLRRPAKARRVTEAARLGPLAAQADASAPAQATGRSHVSAAVRPAEVRLMLPENRSGTASGGRLSPPPTLSPTVADNQSSYPYDSHP
jgi:hypothetical protein